MPHNAGCESPGWVLVEFEKDIGVVLGPDGSTTSAHEAVEVAVELPMRDLSLGDEVEADCERT